MSDPYPYIDEARQDILVMVPADGKVIGSIGCGSAATEAVLVQQGREVHGVDVHGPSVELAASRITSARVISPDDHAIYAPASLDGLILADVVEHLPQAWNRVKEFAGYLKPGGWMVISVPNMRAPTLFLHFIWRGDWPEHSTGIYDETHLQVMSRKRLDRWCAAAGLTMEERFKTYSPMPRRKVWLRRIDLMTFGLFRSWLMFQVQARYRKPA